MDILDLIEEKYSDHENLEILNLIEMKKKNEEFLDNLETIIETCETLLNSLIIEFDKRENQIKKINDEFTETNRLVYSIQQRLSF
jgi:hypothetical protein